MLFTILWTLLVVMVVAFYASWVLYLTDRTLDRMTVTAAFERQKGKLIILAWPLRILWSTLDLVAGVLFTLLILWEVPKRGRLAMSDNLRYHSANSEGKRARIAKFVLRLLKPFRER